MRVMPRRLRKVESISQIRIVRSFAERRLPLCSIATLHTRRLAKETVNALRQGPWLKHRQKKLRTPARLSAPASPICLAGVLPQCAALAHLNLDDNQIGDSRAESFAGELGINSVGEEKLRASWHGQASGLVTLFIVALHCLPRRCSCCHLFTDRQQKTATY